MIEYDYGKIDSIDAIIEDGEARVTVEYKTGVRLRFTINDDDEDDITEEVAEEIDEDEDDVEDIIDFDYN
ncbi:MAG: hypothetical protein COA86_10150 [Kangiella sp.]|nr:MAG: hypothetical protein COA86_10150 [Kangiella sp.]